MNDELDDFTSVLHDVVLPAAVPILPGLDLAAHFSVPADPGEATGAWFDAFRLDSGRVALVTGQVPGSGLSVVAATSGISAVVRAGLLCHEDVGDAIKLAAAHVSHSTALAGTSVVLAIVDLESRDLSWVSAGHPAPLVASVGQPSRELERDLGGPLGAGPAPEPHHQRLEPGDVILLTSHVEAHPEGSGRSLVDLLESSRREGDATATCAAYAEQVAHETDRGAVTVVAAEVGQTLPDVLEVLEVELPVDDNTTLLARRHLETWLETTGATPIDVLSLVHAAAELTANVVEHAHPPGEEPGTARLRAERRDDGAIVVDVVDHGRWRAPRGHVTADIGRGRGLAMAAGLVDDLVVTSGDDGTRARLVHRLTRPVQVDRAASTRPWEVAEPLVIVQTEGDSWRLSGVFGHDEVDQISYAISVASQARTRAIDLDLSEVSAISTGGLGLLSDLVRGGEGRAEVTLHARHGSAAQVELERAGITHRAS